MVHLRGQTGRDLGLWARVLERTRTFGSNSCRLRSLPVSAMLGTLLLVAVPATVSAQPAVGFQGGVTGSPEQVFGGVFFQTNDIAGGVRLRPGIDGAIGQGLRIATINVDVVYGYPISGSGWTFLAGGGPSVVVTRYANFEGRDTGIGVHSIVAFGHDSGFFTELRFGSGRAQRVKFGVGWAIRLE